MARTVEALEHEIRALTAEDRMHLLRDLIAGLDGVRDSDVEKAWLEQSKCRYKQLKDEFVEPIHAEEVFSRARARLDKRRSIRGKVNTLFRHTEMHY